MIIIINLVRNPESDCQNVEIEDDDASKRSDESPNEIFV
jgi:hypothetical protein